MEKKIISSLQGIFGKENVKTSQEDLIAYSYDGYLKESLPEAVGYHWFEWVDEPKEGRFDGENSNYGLVNIQDKPYQEFIETVKKVNAKAAEIHQHAGKD